MKQSMLSDLLIASYSGEWGAETGIELTPVFRTANFNADGSLDYDTPAFRCIPPRKVEAKRLQRGDIILEKSGGTPNRALGIMAYYDRDDLALCSNFNQVLRLDKAKSNPLYMFYQLRWLRERGAFAPYTNKTTGLQNLQMKAFMRLSLKVPEMKEQDRAAETIQSIDLVCKKLNSMTIVFDNLVKSRFVEMFGDLEKRDLSQSVQLKTLLRSPASNGFFSKRKDYVDNGNVGVLGVVNVVNRMYSGIDDLPRTNASNRDISRYSLAYGDMLFCRSSLVLEGIGKASVVPRDVKPGTLFECHVIRVPLDTRKCVPEFMQVQSTMPFFRKQMMAKAKTATMTTIDQKSILSARVFLPPIKQQEEYLAFIQQVDKSKFAVQQAIEQFEILRASLMQEYFG